MGGGEGGMRMEFCEGNMVWVRGLQQEFSRKRLERYNGHRKLGTNSMLKIHNRDSFEKEKEREIVVCNMGNRGYL